MVEESDITKDQLIDILNSCLSKWALGDIDKITKSSLDAPMAAFILGCCFIDAMAGFYAGVADKQTEKKGAGERFKIFSRKYLENYGYDADKLYYSLRCNLVHSYTEGGTYVFTHNNAGFHLESTPLGKKILNLEDFLSDLRSAYGVFIKDISEDDELFDKAKRRYAYKGLLGPIRKYNG
ncbi:hypothetical protein KKH43_05965 [Patescibacteria group bacterium]|nr:hypothetical protein [Patescibacteria group bacterium]